jgi:hypothetical protein
MYNIRISQKPHLPLIASLSHFLPFKIMIVFFISIVSLVFQAQQKDCIQIATHLIFRISSNVSCLSNIKVNFWSKIIHLHYFLLHISHFLVLLPQGSLERWTYFLIFFVIIFKVIVCHLCLKHLYLNCFSLIFFLFFVLLPTSFFPQEQPPIQGQVSFWLFKRETYWSWILHLD